MDRNEKEALKNTFVTGMAIFGMCLIIYFIVLALFLFTRYILG